MLPNEETLVAARPDPYIGKVIDKYKLVERLGAGGMGLVYRAEQARMDRHVAIKLLPFTLVNDQVNVKRIEREAKAMGNLRHPNIATIFDFGFSEEFQPYLVMELIQGRSLGDLLNDAQVLEPQRAIRVMAQAADAMEYAHKNGIIHRDLKPDNIMLDNEHTEDFVKILDFGIAKSVDEAVSLSQSQSLTRPGTIIGSPLYMSPEQCLGQKLDAKTDIYSLGVIMYEILTGHVPCKGATIYETVGKKTTEAPPPFPQELSQMRELEELTLACLATLKTERPESMQVVRDALRAMSAVTQDFQSPIVTLSVPAVSAPPQAQPLVAEVPLSQELLPELVQASQPVVPDALPAPDSEKLTSASTQPYLQASFADIQDRTEHDSTVVSEIATMQSTTASEGRRTAGQSLELGSGVTRPQFESSIRTKTKAVPKPVIAGIGIGAVVVVVVLAGLTHKFEVSTKSSSTTTAAVSLPSPERETTATPLSNQSPHAVPESRGIPERPAASAVETGARPASKAAVKVPPRKAPRRSMSKAPKNAPRRTAKTPSVQYSETEPQYRYGTRRSVKKVSTGQGKLRKHIEKVNRPIRRFFKQLEQW